MKCVFGGEELPPGDLLYVRIRNAHACAAHAFMASVNLVGGKGGRQGKTVASAEKRGPWVRR